MKNPAEELVTAWLQECKGFFTMSNIKVPKEKGGMGAEIDILATNSKENKNIWVEVSVSTNPRCCYKKEIRFESTIKEFLKDFERVDKNNKCKEIFETENYEKWVVYGKLALSKKEKEKFEDEMKKNNVIAISFEKILKDLFKLKQYRLDSARGYVNIIRAFM